MLRLLCLMLLPFLLAPPAPAASPAEVERLWRLMRMPEVISVMRAEGLDYGQSIDADVLDGQGGARWSGVVAAIYDSGRMTPRALDAFQRALAGADVAPMIAFYDSPLGRRVIGLEISARRSMLDPDQDQAARDRAAEMAARGDPRSALIEECADANDLFASNVAGAMNSNFAFYSGLAEGGALDDIDQESILAEVWEQEPAVQADTRDWVMAFLTLAYQPLGDAELKDYIAFSRSPGGQVLNRAIFTAFDGVYDEISRALGLGAAKILAGQDL
jgi:hypothetical protein